MHGVASKYHPSTRLGRCLLVFFMVAAALDPAGAQTPVTDQRDTTHARTQAPFFTTKDAILTGAFLVTTIAMIPLDRRVAERLLDPSTQANRFFKYASTGVEVIASPGPYIIGGTLYAVGRIWKLERVADLGWHGAEAVLFAQGITYVVKGVVGRNRPFLSNGQDPDDFSIGRGFSSGDFASFPSGHTSTAFAAAAAVTNETSRWWPKSVWVIGPVMYTGAAAVGLSRMYHNRHWASDVVIGAAIGTFSGRKVVQYVHGHPGNRIDRAILRTSIIPDRDGGVVIAFAVPVDAWMR